MGIMKHVFCVLILVTIPCAKLFSIGHHDVILSGISQEEINSTFNCSEKESISEFPSDPFTQKERQHGAILVHMIVALYCFIAIAFVCNDYFLPSVFFICEDLHLSHDITAATFMATATCVPELFVNVIGTFLTESDLGVGTVVGSAVCNILGVTACAGLSASKDINLKVWPLLRDSGVYIFVVGVLALILADGVVTCFEALTLVILYFIYFILMFTQKKIKTAVLSYKDSFRSTSSLDPITSAVPSEEVIGTYRSFCFSDFVPHAEKTLPQNKIEKNKEKNPTQEEVEPVCSPPEGFLMKLWWLLSVPVSAILSISIPDCRIHRKFYPLTFFMCVVWIGICSYIVSWMLTVFGYTFHINDAVMGITFLAIGGSIPEASSAVVNARNGIGSMTVSNAIGGNTLDILIGLGGPWLIKTLLPSHIGGGPIIMETAGLAFNCLCLIISVVILNVVTCANSFTMNRCYGFLCLVCYFVFIAVIILSDLNLIFDFGANPCA